MSAKGFLLFLFALISFAGDCAAPPAVTRRLAAYLSYEASLGAGRYGAQVFTFSPLPDGFLFREHGVKESSDSSQRLVYAITQHGRLTVSSCPDDPRWEQCGEQLLYRGIGKSAGNLAVEDGRKCDFTLNVQVWHPSPDSSAKRTLASELFKEILNAGHSGARAVYVRDFNLADPELTFYIVDSTDAGTLLGCHFESALRPHCQWHLFGSSPTEEIKREVLARPYILFGPHGRGVTSGR
jgi:hypothetical protein